MCNVDLMLFQRWTRTLYQCCATTKIRLRIMIWYRNYYPIWYHFQRRINVISTGIHNVETTLIRRWNVGWVVFMNRFILRNILAVTFPTK